MVLGAFLFASMGVCVKFASEWFSSAELVFYRGLIGIVLLGLIARSRGVTLRTAYPAMHAWRSLIGVISLGAWFYAIGQLQLATALTLNYMSSIWIAGLHRRRRAGCLAPDAGARSGPATPTPASAAGAHCAGRFCGRARDAAPVARRGPGVRGDGRASCRALPLRSPTCR